MASNNLKRLAIVGYGNIGAEHHKVFEALGCEVVASCNRSEKGRSRAQASGIEKTFTSIHQMIDDTNPDGIICSTSLFNNYSVCKELIPYRKPILLEKPPGTTFGELNQLIELQEKCETQVMVATNRIWYSVLHKALEDVGGIKEVESVAVVWSEDPIRLRDKRGFTDQQVASRNFSNSIHGLSLLHFLCGPFDRPNLFFNKRSGYFQYNLHLSGVSQRGVLGSFHSSWTHRLPWTLSFYGGQKSYVFSPLEACKVTDYLKGTEYFLSPELYDRKYKPGFYLQAKKFLQNDSDRYNLKSVKHLYKLASQLSAELT